MNTESRQDLHLFWVSFVLLFLELLIIRWLSAELRIFAYFNNLVLIVCFLGIGLGCVTTKKTISMLVALAILCLLVFFVYCPINLGIFSLENITAYLANLKDFVIWYQTISHGARRVWEILLGVMMLGLLTLAVVYLFIPFGQSLGELLRSTTKPLRAYTINILGSIVGILLFTILSFCSSPPLVWFGILFVSVFVLFILERKRRLLLPSLALAGATLTVIWGYDSTRERGTEVVWSPYQKLEVVPFYAGGSDTTMRLGYVINVNNVPYQQAVNLSYDFVRTNPRIYGFKNPDVLKFDHYNLPYLFGGNLENVLIVGAGAGNDAAGALRNGAQRVDAVEIDPLIIEIGRRLHPERPYDSERVTLINDDARSFFHQTRKRYDLIVFGLLDSHTLSSNLSNVRLDNFVYTLQSIREAKSLLKPSGVIVLIFDVRDKFIGGSLFEIMSQVFGRQPLCFNLAENIRGWGGSVFIGGDTATISRTMARYPFLNTLVDHSFAAAPAHVPTDDWPYLYLGGRFIPSLYYIVFALVMVITVAMVRRNFGGLKGIDWHFFFLGAGFLLIEVQNVSKLALLFGSTWLVNSIIIFSILVMILLANYYVATRKIKSRLPYYGGLAASLIFIYFFPLEQLARFHLLPKSLISGALLSVPIFFAGIIFAHSFSKSKELNRVFGSNLIGAMLGGVLQCLSFVVGLNAMLLVALLLYALSFVSMGKVQGSLVGGTQTRGSNRQV